MSKLVKMYPYSRRNGWVMRSYTLADPKNPMRFTAARGWYEVDDALAAQLAKVPQQSRQPKGPRAFMVAKDKNEARELDAEVVELLSGRDVPEEPGTADAPVRMKRPGVKAAGSDSEETREPKPRKRGKRSTVAGE